MGSGVFSALPEFIDLGRAEWGVAAEDGDDTVAADVKGAPIVVK
jgi:hypothetical protein